MISKAPPAGLFSPLEEKINLILPLLFLGTTLTLHVTGRGEYSYDELSWARWAASYIGLNIIHNAFSLSIFWLPETQLWVKEKAELQGKNIALGAVIVAAVLAFYFQAEVYFINWDSLTWQNFEWPIAIAKFLMVVRFALGVIHPIQQQYGLSLIYNRQRQGLNALAEPAKKKFYRLETLDRRMQRFFAWYCAVVIGYKLAFNGLPGQAYFCAAGMALALAINILGFFYPGRRCPQREIFQLRLFLHPLGLVSGVALIGTLFVHGIEYWFVFRKMIRSSSVKSQRRIAGVTLAFSAVVALLALPRPNTGLPNFAIFFPAIPSEWPPVIVGISTAITFFHYYIDSMIFRFSDPVTRKNIGPLLF